MRISYWSSDVCSSDLEGDHQRAEEGVDGTEGAMARHLVGPDGDLRLPVEAEEKFAKRNAVEEAEGLEQQGGDNAQRGHNGDHGAGDHQIVEDALDAMPCAELGAARKSDA